MPNPVIHFEILGHDQPALEEFYRQAFGWEMKPYPLPEGAPAYTMVQGAGIDGGIGACPQADHPGHVTFYVGVPDIKVALGKIQALGGKTVHGPSDVPGGGPTIAHFEDPQGHLIGLVQSA